MTFEQWAWGRGFSLPQMDVAKMAWEAALKAQAGEPDFYVRRRPSPGYEVVSSSDPMAQPAYLHSTTERRVIPEDAELLAFAADEQFFLFCEELEVLDIMRTTLQKYLNAAPEPTKEGD